MLNPMLLRRRLALALVICLGVLALALWSEASTGIGDRDLTYVFCEARAVLDGHDPYAVCRILYHGYIAPSYPLTAALFGVAFLPVQPYSGAVVFALCSGLLAFGLLARGEPWKLLLFLCPPFIQAFQLFQWSPLAAALFVLPDLLPLALIKPTISFPAFILRVTPRRLFLVLAFGLASLAFDPLWPLKWWNATRTYDGYIPLLAWPFGLPLGLFLALALRRWREDRARLLLLMALMPQRAMYDLVPLFLIPASRLQMLVFGSLSMLLQLLLGGGMVGSLCLYLVSLAFVLGARPIPQLRQIGAAPAS